MGGRPESPYNPLSARAVRSPRPWGVTALFAEDTGSHPPLEVEWPLERITAPMSATPAISLTEPVVTVTAPETVVTPGAVAEPAPVEVVKARQPSFANLWEFAVAVNRSDPAALALAGNGATSGIAVEGPEVRKLVGTVWFRDVIARLSPAWRARLLEALVDSVELRDQDVKAGRRVIRLSEMRYEDLKDLMILSVPEVVRADVELLKTVGRFWGGDAIGRFRFSEGSVRREPSTLMGLLQGFRS
jgi:hypothetical protein